MKKIDIIEEINSNIDFFYINQNWSQNFETYINILCADENINDKFIDDLKITNDFIMELSNDMPILLDGGNFEQFLKYSEKALKEFDFNQYPFLLIFFDFIKKEFIHLIENTTYCIELNEISDILDGVIFYIDTEMNDF